MAKKESTFVNMVLTLFIITGLAAFALGGIYNLTKGPIAEAKRKKAMEAINNVLPEYNKIDTLFYVPGKNIDTIWMYKGFNNDEWVGTAVKSYSNNGYDPTQIQVMVGFTPDGIVRNTAVLQQKETPGLGTKMMDTAWRNQFNNWNPGDSAFVVGQKGGKVDAITAATISSEAFCEAMDRADNAFANKVEGGK